jgi:hypothetical protein
MLVRDDLLSLSGSERLPPMCLMQMSAWFGGIFGECYC